MEFNPHFTVDLIVQKRAHFYRVSRPDLEDIVAPELFPGVTGILSIISKPALLPWAKREALNQVRVVLKALQLAPTANVLTDEWIEDLIAKASRKPEQIKDDAADLGTLVHKYIDQIIQGHMPPELRPEMLPAVTAFLDWWQSSQIKLLKGDTKVASVKYKYGGSLDAIGQQGSKLVILDWKTSNGIYNEHALQAGAYAEAFYETFGARCEKGFIIRFGKNLPPAFEAKEILSLESSFDGFLAAKRLKENLDGGQYVPDILASEPA
jgi:hypothetical protein